MPPSSNIPTSFCRCWYISTGAPLPLGRITLGLVLCSFRVFPLWSGSTAHGGDGLVMYPSFFFFPFSILLPHFLPLFSGITSEISALQSLSSRRPKPSTTVVLHFANPRRPKFLSSYCSITLQVVVLISMVKTGLSTCVLS